MSDHSPEWRAHHIHSRKAPVDVFEVYRILVDTNGWHTVAHIGLGIYHRRTDSYDDNMCPTERSTRYHDDIRAILDYLVGIGKVEAWENNRGIEFRWKLTCFDCAYRYGQGFVCKYGWTMGVKDGCCRLTHPESFRVLKGDRLRHDVEALRSWAERTKEHDRARLVEVDA